MKNIIALIAMTILGTTTAMAGGDTLKIKTSAKCGMCEEKIEGNLKFEKGVKYVDLDLESNIIVVEYNPNRTNPEKIRKAVTKLGYDADDMEADKKAHDELPMCCQKSAEKH